MSYNPKISVIMAVYNGEKYLKESIESILNQTFTDFEFIIVDDSSTDSSPEIIQSYNDDRIKKIKNKKNIGLTKSLNKALKQAKGEYIARQDADDISLPNRFEAQIKYFEERPETALLGTSIYRIDENGRTKGKWIALVKPQIKDLKKKNQFIHGSVIVKKEIMEKLGGYNELFIYGQDYELWSKIAKNHDVRNLSQILYKLRFHGKNLGVKDIEVYALYHLLAQKKATGSINEKELKSIKNLYSYLNKREKIFFHNASAIMHIQKNNMKLARKEYNKIFFLDPFNIKNNINIVRIYFGRSAINKTSGLYTYIMNFFYKRFS